MRKQIVTLSSVIAVAVICAALLPAGAWGQDKASHPKVSAAVKSRVPALSEKWTEYLEGKRPPQDGYVVVDRLRDELLLAGKANTAEFQETERLRRAILTKNPHFRQRPPQQLSDGDGKPERDISTQRRILELKVARFVPNDDRILAVHNGAGRAVLEYQYRLEFVGLPPQATALKKLHDAESEIAVVLAGGNEQPISKDALTVKKTLSFKRRFRLKTAENRLLVCSYLLMGYTENTREEGHIIRAKGFPRYYPWVNSAGQFDDFCGIVTFEGDEVYRFPFTQRLPDKLLEPLKIAPDGKWAAVMVGERKTYMEGEQGYSVGYPSEVLIWEAPDRLKRIPAKEAPPEIKSLSGAFLQKKEAR